MPPFWEEGGDFSYLLGTDAMGRDILSRLIFGARETLLVTLFAIALTCLIGVVTGMISGYFGGMADVIIMRISDIFLSVPPIMMAILLAVIMEPGLLTLVLAIAMGAWTQYARLVRGEVLSLKEKGYVRLARVGGAGNLRIMASDMLPNVANTLIILVTLEVGRVTILAATLSFLGLGMQPPSASWGLMLAEGRKYITYAWWQVTFPGIAILITVLGFNLTGDWLRDVLDPKQKLR
jgi:peptide/nickel transport system permease protein